MKRLLTILVLAALVIVSYADYAVAQEERAGRGAFLYNKVDSVSALTSQLSSNSKVADRYAKHFGTSKDNVIKYFKENLQLITLNKARQSTVYFIGRNGSIMSGKRLLPAGTRVFATKDGIPVLEWRCGNPLVKALPTVKSPKPTTQASKPDTQSKPVVQVNEQVDPNPVIDQPTVQVASSTQQVIEQPPITTSVLGAVEETPVSVVAPIVSSVEPVVEAAAAAPITAVPPSVVASSGSPFPWIVPLLIGGGVGLLNDDDNKPSPPVVVPEPMTITVLCSALAATGMGLRRRSKK